MIKDFLLVNFQSTVNEILIAIAVTFCGAAKWETEGFWSECVMDWWSLVSVYLVWKAKEQRNSLSGLIIVWLTTESQTLLYAPVISLCLEEHVIDF